MITPTLSGSTLSTDIRTDEKRALSEYISYYDDPNDDDNNLPTSVKVSYHDSANGDDGLSIEVDGVVTNLDSAIEQSFTVSSLDDIFIVGGANVSNGVVGDFIKVAVSDGFLWSEWTTLDMTTGVNTPATLDLINTSQLELNEWTALSSVFQINDIDGDTVQGIRFEHSDNGTFAKDSTGNILAASTTHEFSSLNDILIGGHSNYAENTIRVQLYDGFEWNNWQEFDLTSGTNVAPELRSITPNLSGSTLSTDIRTSTRNVLSVNISYYDDPNDDDNNLPTSVKVRTTGATGLGIEVDGVVTNLDSAIEQSFTVSSLDDIFVVENENVFMGASLNASYDIILEVRIENSELQFLSSREKYTFYW